MRAVGVPRAQFERALGQVTAQPDRTVLRMGPAAIGHEPPVVCIELAGVAFAEIDPGLIVVLHTGEGEEPEGTQWQVEDDDVARPALGMG
ncbi:hypothetical protein D3C87_1917070 [compost metagenome]